MKRIIIFGAGYWGRNVFHKLKEHTQILFYVDNNIALQGKELNGIEIISCEKLESIYTDEINVCICVNNYQAIAEQLRNIGIKKFYVMLEGFLYRTNLTETMVPIEIAKYYYYKKEVGEKNILFVQNSACIRTHKIASIMRGEGYKVFLLYTLAPPVDGNSIYREIYDKIYGFYSAKCIVDFINNSDFDIIHSSNTPDILTNVVLMSQKRVVYDTHDMHSLWGYDSIENLTLEHIANTLCDGNIYTSKKGMDIARQKYDLSNKNVMYLENTIYEQFVVDQPYDKLSKVDGEMHCVYEGGINLTDKSSDRYFKPLWKYFTDELIHIHFYTQMDSYLCKEYEKESPYLHYEGNLGSNQLIKEMTKYDCGLALFNVTDKNRVFIETASANKIYEYLNAKLPVVIGGLKNYTSFVESYKVGIGLDYSKSIKMQIANACRIKISNNFLNDNNFTMKSRTKDLVEFYEKVKMNPIFRK